jgi:hypothetical protein
MPPWKPYLYPVGSTVDNLYGFLQSLFDPANQQAFRDSFFNLKTEAELRDLLLTNKIYIPVDDSTPQKNPIRIMVVDVEYARCISYDKKIDPKTDFFYLLVMPPVPHKYDTKMQTWESAWYHAIVDGFGM